MQETNNITESNQPTIAYGKELQAIILAGGLGTRLQSVVADVPKCLAPVAGKPFLDYVIQYLQKQGVNKFIFSLGYLSNAIELFLKENYPLISYQLSIETSPLGTGGAIQLACKKADTENVLVLNGDTIFAVDINAMLQLHLYKNAACTLALKPMKNFERYGVVTMDDTNCIQSFEEKKFYSEGFINGGVYLLNKEKFLANNFAEKFSFEKAYLEKFVSDKNFFGLQQDAYFIDIGIPEDFERAQKEFGDWMI